VRPESSAAAHSTSRPTTLADYVAILRRRKWILVALPLVAAVSAYAVAHTQSARYRATAQVLVNRSNVVSAITNISDPSVFDATRFLATEASIARAPELARQVVGAARVPGASAGGFLAASHATADPNADLLDVSVTWPTPEGAVRLTNAYAEQFTRYKTQLDTQEIRDALRKLNGRIAALRAAGPPAAGTYATLLQYQSELETVGTLMASNTSVLTPAGGATQVQPRPTRSAVLGGLLGIVLGLGLAFLVEALDRRVREEDEVEEVLGIPLIGRLPPPPRHLRNGTGLVMLSQPGNPQAEAFRKLKTSIEFLNLEHGARTIMITSALPREGKSTTIANLAVAFARSGRRVALVDLDLRQPSIHPFFATDARAGITDVLAGSETLEGALRPRFLPSSASFTTRANGGSRNSQRVAVDRSALTVLGAGTLAPAGGDMLAELLESEKLGSVLGEMSDRFELVLVDTPPLLVVGDTMPLTSHVDAVVLVLHAGVRRPVLHELARELQKSQAPILGFVLTGVSEGDAYGSTYGYGYYEMQEPGTRGSDPRRAPIR
jgi:Mrp family chromosome partitioning ATPase/capsular polysaccharide biosynthesis protein